MVKEGTYQHVKSENLDEYFAAAGVPYIPRKIMSHTSPTIEISKTPEGKWTISSSTTFRTVTNVFSIGETFEEAMPGGILQCVASLDGDNLVIFCTGPGGKEITRIYSTTDDELTINFKQKGSDVEANRHFKRKV